MYKIREDQDREKYLLLIPSMLDAHYPLFKYAFYSKEYHPIIIEEIDGVTDEGLKYINNDMCYPCILNTGQMISALKSGKYDVNRVKLLMPSAGDACRGSNYLRLIQKAVKDAGFENVPVVSINLKGLEKGNMLKITPGMVWRALLGMYYGDILMLLLNQTRPNEVHKGDSEKVWSKWIEILADNMRNGRHMSLRSLKKNYYKICEDFSKIELIKERKQRVGIVGELYIKYCSLGNWDMIKYLEENDCESHTNGLSWYAMYYLDSHLTETGKLEASAYKLVIKFFGNLQNEMIKAMRQYGFYTMEPFAVMKEEAKDYVSQKLTIGDGWLMGSECVGHILHECPKVLAIQPFGCMPNHCCGRGKYPYLNRMLDEGQIVSIDVDSSGSRVIAYNRVRLLIDWRDIGK